MFLVYFFVGILIVLALNSALKVFVSSSPERVRRFGRYVSVALIVLVVFLLLRAGLPYMAAIVSFLGAVAPFVERFRAKRNQASAQPAKAGLSKKEACEILGVRQDANQKEILDAYRSMMQKNHPDQGGSEYLARKINEARDALLKK